MSFDELIGAFARKIGVDDLRRPASGSYTFEFDGLRVTFSKAADGMRLLLDAPIGMPPTEGREALYRAILESTEGDEFVAINPDDGCLHLLRIDPQDGLDLLKFESNLERFLNCLEEWHGVLADYAPVAGDRSRAEAVEIDERRKIDIGMVRVVRA